MQSAFLGLFILNMILVGVQSIIPNITKLKMLGFSFGCLCAVYDPYDNGCSVLLLRIIINKFLFLVKSEPI